MAHTIRSMGKSFEWDKVKNLKLIRERGVSFEMIMSHIEGGGVVAVATGKGKFSHQKQFIVLVNKYIYIVPFVEDEEKIFMKTIIPSRKMTKLYLLGGRLK